MTQARVSFEVDGVDLLTAYLNRIIGGIRSLKQFFPDVVRDFEKMQRDWFSSQGRGSWQPLSPTYAIWKDTFFPGLPLLVLSGDLKRTAYTKSIDMQSLTISIKPPDYWAFHQFGTSRMPARPPYIIDKDMGAKLGETLRRAIISFMSRQ